MDDSKKYRAPAAWGLGKEVESSLKVYSEHFSRYLNQDGKTPSVPGVIRVVAHQCQHGLRAEDRQGPGIVRRARHAAVEYRDAPSFGGAEN